MEQQLVENAFLIRDVFRPVLVLRQLLQEVDHGYDLDFEFFFVTFVWVPHRLILKLLQVFEKFINVQMDEYVSADAMYLIELILEFFWIQIGVLVRLEERRVYVDFLAVLVSFWRIAAKTNLLRTGAHDSHLFFR